MKQPQFFIQNPDSGEPFFHCASSIKDATKAIGYFLETELMELEDGDEVNFVIKRQDMTEEEVNNIPEY